MVGATTLALFFVPLFYVLISQTSERFFPAKVPVDHRLLPRRHPVTQLPSTREDAEPCAGCC